MSECISNLFAFFDVNNCFTQTPHSIQHWFLLSIWEIFMKILSWMHKKKSKNKFERHKWFLSFLFFLIFFFLYFNKRQKTGQLYESFETFLSESNSCIICIRWILLSSTIISCAWLPTNADPLSIRLTKHKNCQT